MATLTSPRKPHNATRPVRGGCRWAVQPTATHPGCLVITTADARGQVNVGTYLVYEVRDGGRLIGYRLSKPDGVTYDLAADLSSCDCPDATYHPERPGGCRHQRALRAALLALGE